MPEGMDAELPAAQDQRSWLQERRMRRPQAPPRPNRIAWIVVVVLHALFFLGLRLAMTPQAPRAYTARDAGAIQVRFVPPEAVEPIPSPPPGSPLPSTLREPLARIAEAPPRAQAAPPVAAPAPAAVAQAAPDEVAPRLKLFNPDGSLHLSRETIAAAEPAAPLYRSREVVTPRFMRHESPIAYAPTRFESSWVPRDETIVGEFFRKATVEKTFKTPWGTRISCAWIIVMGGCSFGSAPTPLADAPPRPEMSNPVPGPPEPGPPPPIAPYRPPPFEKGVD